jgi:hypothetical protein
VRPFRSLPTEAGMHRWIWDLHYAAPTSARHEYPISAVPHDTPRLPLGPTALPGQYTVRLGVNSKTYSSKLVIRMDPRVETSAAALEKKFQVEVKLASIMDRGSQAVVQASSLRDQMHKLEGQSSGAVKEAVQMAQKKLSSVLGTSGGFFAPVSDDLTLSRVNGQIGTLYTQVWQVDAAPTSSQLEALAAIERDYDSVMRLWNEFKTADLAALNRQLRQANLPEAHLESDVRHDEAQTDEE